MAIPAAGHRGIQNGVMVFQRFLKKLSVVTLMPAIRWYLRKERRYVWGGIPIRVFTGVFHPGFFSSTSFLLSFLKEQDLNQRSLLELGCGTGLISIFASKKGAVVTASDLSLIAIENARVNAKLNNADVAIVQSDLFDNIPVVSLDWIVINPPYYAKNPDTEASLAWYCGENFDYFRKLFSGLGNYMHAATQVIMVLTKGCDTKSIIKIAESADLKLRLIREKSVLFDEKDYLFSIEKVNSSGGHPA